MLYLNVRKLVLHSRKNPLPTGERKCLICGTETEREGTICGECEITNLPLLPPEDRQNTETPTGFVLRCHKCGTPVHPKLIENVLGKGKFFRAGTYLCKFCRDSEQPVSQEQMDRLKEKWGVTSPVKKDKEKKRK